MASTSTTQGPPASRPRSFTGDGRVGARSGGLGSGRAPDSALRPLRSSASGPRGWPGWPSPPWPSSESITTAARRTCWTAWSTRRSCCWPGPAPAPPSTRRRVPSSRGPPTPPLPGAHGLSWGSSWGLPACLPEAPCVLTLLAPAPRPNSHCDRWLTRWGWPSAGAAQRTWGCEDLHTPAQ